MAIIQKNLVGIEIGTKNIKMVKVNSKGKVTHHTYIDIPEKIITNGHIESKQMLTETLKAARKKLGTGFSDCSLCFSTHDTVIRHITIPQMQDDFIQKNIILELSGFLPMNPEMYAIDYILTDSIETEEKKALQFLVYAIPADIIKMYAQCLKDAGFKLKYIDIIENAYGKLHKLLKESFKVKESNFAFLYIDNSKAAISIYGNDKLFINKNLDAGVSKICEDIAAKTGKPLEFIMKSIYTDDIFESEDLFAVEASIIQDYIKEVTYEASRVIDYFKNQNKESTLEAVYFAGGFSHIKGIQSYFAETLGMPVVLTSKFLDPMFDHTPDKKGIDYTNAIAITLREEKIK